MTTASVTSKGQVTIQAAVRKGRSKTGEIGELYGFLKYEGEPLTIEQMNEAVGIEVVDDFRRSLSG